MKKFRIGVARVPSGPDGTPSQDLALEMLDADPVVEWRFLAEQGKTLGARDVAGFDALLGLRATAAMFGDGASELVAVANRGVGMDGWDLEACNRAGVLAFNTQGSNSHGVAAAVLGYMLLLSKKLIEKDRAVRAGIWPHLGWFPGMRELFGNEIQGKVLGIIGLGLIGREVARLVTPFEMRVLAYDPHADPQVAAQLGVTMVGLDDLLTHSDFVSLHCPVTPETRGIIGARALSLMKPSAFLINVCRGALVDHDALAQALAGRRIEGAAMDSWDPEPFNPDHLLFRVDNALLAPHCAGGSEETHRNMSAVAMRGLLRLAHGELPEGIRNPEVLDNPGFLRKLAQFRTGSAA